MEVSYLGLHLTTLSYLMFLLFFLVVFLCIWIISEMKRQRRYKKRLDKLRKAELRLIN